MKRMSVEDKLGLNIYHTDEFNSHIDVDLEFKDEDEIKKLIIACPAACYTYVDGVFSFSHLGCLECGTCRVLSHYSSILAEYHNRFNVFNLFYSLLFNR